MKTILKTIACAGTLSLAGSAYADHNAFHIECQEGATGVEAINGLHAVLHTMGEGTYSVGDHGYIDVESVGDITVVQSAEGFAACAVVSWVQPDEHDHERG